MKPCFWALVALTTVGLAQGDFRPTMTLSREGKPVRTVKTSPDDLGLSVIEYREVARGELESIDLEAKTLKLAGKEFVYNDQTQLTELDLNQPTPGTRLEVIYKEPEEGAEGPLLAEAIWPATVPEPEAKPPGDSLTRFVFYDPEPFRVEVDFNGEAQAFGHLAFVEQIPRGHSQIILAQGQARGDADRLVAEYSPTDKAVELLQGQSQAYGTLLTYDNQAGRALLSGPVQFTRSGQEPLTGTAQQLSYDVDGKKMLLTGQVKLVQEDQTTEAEQALIDDEAGVAFLYGDPVVTTSPDGVIRGKRFRYHLETGDVVVLEGVQAELKPEEEPIRP